MPRARRVKKIAQNGLEIHLRLPRLLGPFPMVKHKQVLPFHASAKDLDARWSVETTQKHLPVRFLHVLAPKLICFSFYGPRKLRGMFQEQLFSERSRNRPRERSWNRPVPELGFGTETFPGTLPERSRNITGT